MKRILIFLSILFLAGTALAFPPTPPAPSQGAVAITGGTITGITDLAVPDGGTGASTLTDGGILVGAGAAAIEAVPVGLTTEILVGGGAATNPVWTTATGSGAPVRATSPTLVTPVLGTPASGDLSNTTLLTPPVIGKTTPAEGWLSPSVAKGPAIINSGFAGTVSNSSTTVTFSSAADAILAGYSATNPVLGTTIIATPTTATKYIVSWTNSTTCVVDSAPSWSGATITSVQLPIATFVDSSGATAGYVDSAKNFRSVVLVAPVLGTPASGTLTNATGLPTTGLVDGAVTLAKMDNLAQDKFIGRTTASTGVPETATITAAARTVLDDTTVAAMVDTLGGASATGTGGIARATSPSFVTPVLGTPTSGTLDSCTTATASDNDADTTLASTAFAKSQDAVIANPKAPSQGVNMTAAASGSTGITVGDDADLDWGTGDGAVRIVYTLLDHTPSAVQYLLYRYEDAANYIYLQVETSGALTLKATVDTGIAWNTSSNAPSFVDGTMHDVLVALDRDGNLTYYIDGVAAGTLDISADAAKSMDIAAALYALGTSAVRTAGTVQSVEWFNRCPSAAEVLDLYRNGVSFADKWGSQTALSSDTAWTGATGATPPTGWSSVNGGVYTIFDSSDGAPYDACLKIEHGGAQNYPYIKKSSPVTVVIGKKYRFSFAFKHGTSTNGAVGLGTSDAGVEYQIWNTLTDATWTIYTKEFTATSTNVYYYLQSNTAISGQYELFDEVTLTEIGATLALEEKGIWLDKWYDSSSNNLVASYPTVGWTLTQQANKKRVKQPTPTAETTAVTLTIAKLLTGIITATHTAGATQAYTLPTGALTDAWPAFGINDYFDWYLINLSAAAADTVTVTAAATGHTIVGNPIVQSAHSSTGGVMGNSAGFRTRKTAAATFVSYRIN